MVGELFFQICSVVLYLKKSEKHCSNVCFFPCDLQDNYTMNNYPYKTRINR